MQFFAETLRRDIDDSTTVERGVRTGVHARYDTRASQTVGTTTTEYLWDRAAQLPLLVDDEDNAYLHADGLIAEIDGTSNDASYHLTDGLGSVRGLTDGTGALTGSTAYDPFGSVQSQSGQASVFGYTGEQHDAVTGNTYLRARYLSPTTGRFLSADTVQPNAPGTQGYNRYSYVANNPTTWTDPTGHQSHEGAFQRVLSRDWLSIGIALGLQVAAYSCAANQGRCFKPVVYPVIVVLIILACVLDRSGPCWTWLPHISNPLSGIMLASSSAYPDQKFAKQLEKQLSIHGESSVCDSRQSLKKNIRKHEEK